MTTAGIDRVPSFYTSRSIVNLSGLSVSDPAPVADGSSYRDEMASVLAHHQHLQQQSLPTSSTRQDHQLAATNLLDVFNQSCEAVNSTDSVDTADVTTVEDVSGLEGICSNSSSISRNRSENSLPQQGDGRSSNSSLPRRHSATFEDTTQGPKVVEKTTNMASFYYRQANSPNSKSDSA